MVERGLTHIDCDLFRGEESESLNSSYIAVNPLGAPAKIAFAGSAAARANLGGQVAFKLALEHFLAGVESYYGGDSLKPNSSAGALNALEHAFKNANSKVYEFGHKLAAGGRMAASMVGLVLDSGYVAAGRVGLGSAYLVRKGKVFPFFAPAPEGVVEFDDYGECLTPPLAKGFSFLGSNSLIDVELASAPLEGNDVAFVFSRPLSAANETLLIETAEALFRYPEQQPDNLAAEVARQIFRDMQAVSFVVALKVGPEAVYLK